MNRRFSLTIPDTNLVDCEILCENLSVDLTGKKSKKERILNNITTDFRSCQLIAIMGSSGAGKTTLLNSLTGFLPKNAQVFGNISINGAARNAKLWPSMYGYVRQFETFYENLTVLETLTFAANMKMRRRGFTNSETSMLKKQRLQGIMDYLGLAGCCDRKMKEISGGERRRVSIALEVITEPPILFLDEPTSGLDTATSLSIIQLLSNIAKVQRKTVIITIHQPNYETLLLFNKILLLSKGSIIFDGPVNESVRYFGSLGYEVPIHTNPFDFFVKLISVDNSSPEDRKASIEFISELADKWRSHLKKKPILPSLTHAVFVDEKITSLPFQYVHLFFRYFRNHIRDVSNQISAVLQFLMMLLLFGLVFLQLSNDQAGIQSRFGFLLLIMMFVYFSIAFPTLGSFPVEMKLIRRERSSRFYSGISVYFSKISALIPANLTTYVLGYAITYWIVGLNSNVDIFFTSLFIIFSICVNSQLLSLFIGAISPSAFVAQSIGPPVIFLFIVFAGNFSNPESIPAFLAWIRWVSPIQYAYNALVQSEFAGQTFSCPANSSACYSTGDQFLISSGLTTPDVWISILVLWAFNFLFLLLGLASIEIKSRPVLLLHVAKAPEVLDKNDETIVFKNPADSSREPTDTTSIMIESSDVSTQVEKSTLSNEKNEIQKSFIIESFAEYENANAALSNQEFHGTIEIEEEEDRKSVSGDSVVNLYQPQQIPNEEKDSEMYEHSITDQIVEILAPLDFHESEVDLVKNLTKDFEIV